MKAETPDKRECPLCYRPKVLTWRVAKQVFPNHSSMVSEARDEPTDDALFCSFCLAWRDDRGRWKRTKDKHHRARQLANASNNADKDREHYLNQIDKPGDLR